MNLPDSLLDRARERAELEGRTVTSLMEEALRDLLERLPAGAPEQPLPTWKGGGRVLVDLDDKDALEDVLDSEPA